MEWQGAWTRSGLMKRGRLISGVVVSASVVVAGLTMPEVVRARPQRSQAQQSRNPPAATFRSNVDLVRVAAIVRDHKGRFVPDLTARDFEVLDAGESRPITDFQRDQSGVSVALLFDVSGSMEGHLANAREAAEHVISWLDRRDETAIFTFDTRL